MKKLLCLVLFLLITGLNGARAQNPNPPNIGTVSNGAYIWTPLGCQQISAPSSATGFSSVPTGATLASIAVESNSVRYRDDGIAPTSSVGTLLAVGGPWPYTGNLAKFQVIQTAVSATVDVCFYR